MTLPVNDLEAARDLPELPSAVVPVEEIAAALEVLAAGQPLTMPNLDEEEA